MCNFICFLNMVYFKLNKFFFGKNLEQGFRKEGNMVINSTCSYHCKENIRIIIVKILKEKRIKINTKQNHNKSW